jgi:hypothetical protein
VSLGGVGTFKRWGLVGGCVLEEAIGSLTTSCLALSFPGAMK